MLTLLANLLEPAFETTIFMPLMENSAPHVAILSSAGMGHLNPASRLAAELSGRGCEVTFIASQPTVSSAESLCISNLLSSFPRIRPLDLPLAPLDPSSFPPDSDPFFLRFEAILRSAHLLPPLLDATSPPLSAIVVDVSVLSAYLPIAKQLDIPCYVLYISLAAMLSFVAYFPTYISISPDGIRDVVIPGMWTVPRTSIMSPLHDPDNFFRKQFVENGRALLAADGVLINTLEALEPEPLSALKGGHVASGFPPVFTIGPQMPLPSSDGCSLVSSWLDRQPAQSVVYVGFGNRSALSTLQIKELAAGMEMSQCRFLWVLKTKKVDREEGDTELEGLLGEGYAERVKDRGLVVNAWVEQEEILRHRAIGGFLSHIGSNSVLEAAAVGVRVLGWPRGGDQRIIGEVVRRSGLGVWMEEWSWEAGGEVIGGEEIGRRVREMMEDEELMVSAARIGEEARKAVAAGGSTYMDLEKLVKKLHDGKKRTGNI